MQSQSASADWIVSENWTRFVFPFLFDTRESVPLESLLANDLWVESPLRPRELDNMLPYVKQYLQLPTNHRRFMMRPSCLSPESLFQFVDVNGTFRIHEVVLHLFFNGVACLALEVRPANAATITEIESINARMASLTGEAHIVLATEPSPKANGFTVAALCHESGHMSVRQLVDALMDSFDPKPGWTITPMVDRFLPVYGAILLHAVAPASIETLDRQFFEFAQHHLTILRKTFTPNNISNFSEIHLEDSTHHYMPYHNVIHSQSLDGGYILCYDNGLPHFSRQPAPAMESFRTSYFFMMLIPFHQRLSILRYAMRAASAGLSPERGTALRRLREEIYDFTARCYFSQASVSEERNHIYDRWQQEFHVVRMYDDLKEEVHDIDNYLAELGREHDLALRDQAMRRDSRNMQLFSFITLVFLPISLVLYAIPAIAVLARWINFTAHPWRSFSLIAGMAAFVVFLLTLMLRFVRRARRLPGA